MAELDGKLAQAEVRAAAKLSELSEAAAGLSRDRQEAVEAVESEEAAWQERVATREDRRLALAEANQGAVERVYAEVVEMGR
eukprot:scaffold638527_cov37-Prasinocladus_malaysianus.AAC.1